MRSSPETFCRFVCVWSLFIFLMGILFVLSFTSMRLMGRFSKKVYQWTHRVMGIKVHVHGSVDSRVSLFISNHVSYVDILVLGGVLDGHFISKGEVRRWPLIGFVSQKVGTFFVSRRRDTLIKELGGLRRNMALGQKYILFPEGTSGDGVQILPFKPSLFQLLRASDDASKMYVQPVFLELVRLNGLPMRSAFKKFYSWRGDQSLVEHLWFLTRLGCFDLNIKIGPAVYVDPSASRHQISAQLHEKMVSLSEEKQDFVPIS